MGLGKPFKVNGAVMVCGYLTVNGHTKHRGESINSLGWEQ
jgi:hypothetical protein